MKKQYIYLIQGQAALIETYRHLTERTDADAIFLTYDEPLEGAIFYPNSAWANGRNKLLEAALAKGRYIYYIFCDDDVEFIKGGWDEFERQLQRTLPAVAVPIVPKTTRRNTFRFLENQAFLVNDEQMIAFHDDVIRDRILVPYFYFESLFVWMSCEVQQCLIQTFYPNDSIQFNTVEILNECHRYEVTNQDIEAFRTEVPKWLSAQIKGRYTMLSFSKLGFLKILLRTIKFKWRRFFNMKTLSFSDNANKNRLTRIVKDSDLYKQISQ